MSQFDHESPDQSALANALVRELRTRRVQTIDELQLWKQAVCAALNVIVVRNGEPASHLSQDFAYSAANAADAVVLEYRKRYEEWQR